MTQMQKESSFEILSQSPKVFTEWFLRHYAYNIVFAESVLQHDFCSRAFTVQYHSICRWVEGGGGHRALE